jgi:hypothetical protein
METPKNSNNNNTQRNRNLSLLKQRDENKAKSKNKQLTMSQAHLKTTSIFCVVLTLCQASQSHALIQSRARPELTSRSQSFLSLSNKSTLPRTSSSNRIHHSNIPPQQRLSSLQYRDYSLNDNDERDGSSDRRDPKRLSDGVNVNASAIDASSEHEDRQQDFQERLQHLKQLQEQQKQDRQRQRQQIEFAKVVPHSSTEVNHEQQENHHISSFLHTIWNSGKTRRAQRLHAAQFREKEQKQYVLDDYLESIDRRYKRLHKGDEQAPLKVKKSSDNSGGFTNALQWLTAKNSDSVSETEEQRRQEDAIYVLGLADLASTRLLQKHHLPVPQSKMNKSVVIDINSSLVSESVSAAAESSLNLGTLVSQESESSSLSATKSAVAIHKFLAMMKMLRRMDLNLLADFAISTSTEVNKLTATTVRAGCRSFSQGLASFLRFVTNKSGGKHSVQAASLLITAIFAFAVSLIRPALTKA